MRQLIDEFGSLPGVIGTCVYSPAAGVEVNTLPEAYPPDRLTAIGNQLDRLYSAGRANFNDFTDLSVHFDESRVVARELQQNLLVYTVCDLSCPFQQMSLLFERLQEYLEANGSDRVKSAVLENSPQFVEEQELPDERLGGLLDEMRSRLGKVLGPMAGIIFDEMLETWEERKMASIGRIGELLELINREISDPDKISHYHQLVDPVLNSYQEG